MYKIIKNILSVDECEYIFSEFEKTEKEKDYQVLEADILFGWEISDKFCEKFKTQVEDFYSTKLNTVLGHTRKSFKGQTLVKHKDVTEFVMSIAIKQSDTLVNPLYLYIGDKKNKIILEQGDGVIFEGSKIFHERDPIISDWILGMYLGYERDSKFKLI